MFETGAPPAAGGQKAVLDSFHRYEYGVSVLFVDESKAKGYTMVAALVATGDVASLRRNVRSLVLPGQRRIHFTKERSERKRMILSRFFEFGVQAQIFHCATKSQAQGREACWRGIVNFAVEHSHARIVIERDESIEQLDRQTLFREVRRHGIGDTLSYEHALPHQEPLLWVADAIAWSATKGGEWKTRITPLIAGSTTLSL